MCAFYGVFLDLRDKPCLVVGGGRVAERKIAGLLTAGARVRVVSPELTVGLQALAAEGKIEHVARPYQTGDMIGFHYAFAATDRRDVNARAAADAHSQGCHINVADQPELGDLFIPAQIHREGLHIAISTEGTSPHFASVLRSCLDKRLPQELGTLLKWMGELREAVHALRVSEQTKQQIIREMVSEEELGRWLDGDERALQERVQIYSEKLAVALPAPPQRFRL